MYTTDHERIASLAAKKNRLVEISLPRYLVLSALAGVYVGFGIALIFSVGGPLATAGSPIVKLVMGISFGIALTLVIFAGSELFTGNNMTGCHNDIEAVEAPTQLALQSRIILYDQ